MKKHTKFLPLFLALTLLLGLAAPAFAAEETAPEGYTLLTTITNYEDYIAADDTRGEWELIYQVNLASKEFAQFYKDGDAEAGLAEIIKAGEVYVNGYQIPYVKEDGSYSVTDFKINGQSNVWQADAENDLWGWQLHMYYQYDGGPMGALSGIEGFVSGQAVPFETAITYYVKYLGNIRGQALKLYAKAGESTVSRIEATRLDTSIVGGVVNNGDGTVTLNGTDGKAIQTFKSENFDASIQAGDGVIFWEENDTGWIAKRGYAITSYLVENLADDHSPWIYVNGENASTEDSLADKEMAEGYRHTQFIRGYRRTRQFDDKTVVTMWSSTPDGYGFAFTYPESSARGALEYAVKYTGDYAATLKVSADGSDVAATDLWVTKDAMDTFNTALASAKALLADSIGKTDAATVFAYNEMILTLADAFGGKEGNKGPGANNSVGIFGSAQPGTAAAQDSTAVKEETTYTVVKGDCLWNIAKKAYGNGALWTKIYEANKGTIQNANLIYVGQVLVLPE